MNYQREYSRIKDINKTFSKDETHKKLAGVCAGIAKYFDYSRLVIRLGTVGAFMLFPIPVAIAYGMASILLPKSRC